jgi:hypothetical protein
MVVLTIWLICTITKKLTSASYGNCSRSVNLNALTKNALKPAGTGGRHCPGRKFLRPVGNAVVPLFNMDYLECESSMLQKNLSTPSRFAPSREALAHAPNPKSGHRHRAALPVGCRSHCDEENLGQRMDTSSPLYPQHPFAKTCLCRKTQQQRSQSSTVE